MQLVGWRSSLTLSVDEEQTHRPFTITTRVADLRSDSLKLSRPPRVKASRRRGVTRTP